MSSCPLGPQGNDRESESLSSDARPAGEAAADREALESVLQWAEATLKSDDPLEVADVEAVREVARRHRGVPLALDPIVVELVQALLRTYFQTRPSWLPVWQNACRVVAETLFEDPVSHDRLEVLWSRLLRRER
jgi:hypothetical protein